MRRGGERGEDRGNMNEKKSAVINANDITLKFTVLSYSFSRDLVALKPRFCSISTSWIGILNH